MLRFTTESGSVYEVDCEDKKIRRLNGIKSPTARQGKDGEWKNYSDLLLTKGASCIIVWDAKTTPLLTNSFGNLPSTITSIVIEILNV